MQDFIRTTILRLQAMVLPIIPVAIVGTVATGTVAAIFTAIVSSPRRQNCTVEAIQLETDYETLREKVNVEVNDLCERLKITEDARAAEILRLFERLTSEEEARDTWIQSIPLEMWPSSEQLEKAKSMLEDPNAFFYHFAVAGYAGTGKSSLINALRGCKDMDEDAASVGIVETTMDIKRYPDSSSIFNKFIWYDIPGAGTLAHSGWQYFNNHGLFIFDFIIICWKDRVTETDIQILDSCEQWRIPTFLVRTNSLTSISNLMKSEDITEEKAISKLKEETHKTVKRNLKDGNYRDPNKKVYIVDRHNLGRIVSDFAKFYSISISDDAIHKNIKVNVPGVIDESNLLMDLLRTARERRC